MKRIKLNAHKRLLTSATEQSFTATISKLESVFKSKAVINKSKLRDKTSVQIAKLQGPHDLGECILSYYEGVEEIALNLVIYGKFRDTKPYVDYKGEDSPHYHATLIGSKVKELAEAGLQKATFDLTHDKDLDIEDKERVQLAVLAIKRLIN